MEYSVSISTSWGARGIVEVAFGKLDPPRLDDDEFVGYHGGLSSLREEDKGILEERRQAVRRGQNTEYQIRLRKSNVADFFYI